MAHKQDSQLWDKRATQGNVYKGETLYTITPLPFYVKRRQLLLDLVEDEVLKAKNIIDFGCGDGWYLKYFRDLHNKSKVGSKVVGVDVSPEMVKKAREYNPDLEVKVIRKGINEAKAYDLIYTFATLAHIDDDTIQDTFRDFYKSLQVSGKLILFEQVAPSSYSGSGFIRRSIKDYAELGRQAGLMPVKHYLLSFDAHRFFERYIAKKYIRLCKGGFDYEKRLRANSHVFYRMMSTIALAFDKNPVRENAKSGWGNVIMIFERRD